MDFYASMGHRVLPRAPMLDDSIPMSFVMSAGLVQVEQSLARLQVRDSNQFVLVQDCFRHFDLDKVGIDDYHLSIFEMPGAFKFGPNGKVETVQRMWQLATSVMGIDRDCLWATYFGGGRVLNDDLPEDEVIYQAWVDTGLPLERIIGLGYGDNYWVQGGGINGEETTQRSGPNTELFFDKGKDKACGSNCRPGCKCGRFVEFSNSLFIRYELNPDNGKFESMDDPFSETVIGTERVAMILQGKKSVFDIDGYKPIIDAIHGFVDANDRDESLVAASVRVIADHLKALYLLVADGAPPPGKDGRARIIKLLIRGIITRQIFLGIESQNFIPAVLDCVAEVVHTAESDTKTQARVLDYFSDQRPRFMKTIERGHRQLTKGLDNNGGATLSGEQIVLLEKKIGLPHLLTAKVLWEKGLQFERSEYEDALAHWKKQIRLN